jgi:predicted ArsR family transcriptional regulator
MDEAEAVREATLEQCVVLLGTVAASADRETPVNPAELRRVCNERLARPDAPVLGGLSEADVTRALYALEAEGMVENVAEGETSPAGKGRPAYDLKLDAETVLSMVAAEEEALAPIVEDLED